MNKQIDRQAEMLKIIEDARETYANDVTDHTENEYIREGLLNANYRKASDVAAEILREVRQALLNMVLANSMGETYDLEKRLAEIEKKYESEGADDE